MASEQHTGKVSGFKVPYEVRDCEFGKGLFVTALVPKGQMVWEYKAGYNVLEFNE